jgi:hypothetical protein
LKRKALGSDLTRKPDGLAFTHKKEFVKLDPEAKKDETRARRMEKMNQMLSAGKVMQAEAVSVWIAELTYPRLRLCVAPVDEVLHFAEL